MPDWWTRLYFGHSTGLESDHSRAGDAADGNCLLNLHEFLAGTDPTNSVLAFRITDIAQEGDDIRVTWTTGGGRSNMLQAMAGETSGAYTTNFVDLGEVNHNPRHWRHDDELCRDRWCDQCAIPLPPHPSSTVEV